MRVELVAKRDASPKVFVIAEINERGDLVLSDQTLGGNFEKATFGPSQVETSLTVRAANKDALLLALLEALYREDVSAVPKMGDLLAAKGIEFEALVA